MPMHECFSGLFSESPIKGVARVSGVANPGFERKSRGIDPAHRGNTPHDTGAGRVSTAPAATPDPAQGYGGGVAQKAEGKQGDREYKTHETSETPPKPITRADFLSHANRFCSMPCPAIYSAECWGQIQADAKSFSDLWGSMVSALGWNPDDVFAIPDGLIPMIEGGDILAVCEKTAVVRAPSRKQFNTIRLALLPGDAAPRWRVWASWSEP